VQGLYVLSRDYMVEAVMRDMGCLWMGVFMVEDGGYLAVRNNMMCVCVPASGGPVGRCG
jgi:hypothetical protein